ncbi:MAG: hypothetical protein A2275_08900 [Bacteroidetes bacterium RIFOXYA12_FULL_35_11]|nr:MAG: hypothetical protein A2X01_06025 [Bacteroidetes bacterium GWF2_35_48]OFY82918.1 MAG: hypothetical protein A2275_08900 [Bacteroidetes bacterium RIFOXYA12_FULL_35_11]OFY95980.1 MAG: hypothetical protein A2309_05360 [Bacteroidetes bacterium RIFOXYB2_FULL_35_7]OFZ01872.1 MAG: hypothetical protein A2491_02360 [Bacteroidetes bacterium RIFOXYC12_FULL_35_7]HBX52770.1 2-phosphosulfolactate phosphatase [Bacteroidales bacterium]
MADIETCFSPALFPLYKTDESIVVVVDIFRATTSICAAFHNGVKELIPVATIEEARQMKDKGYVVAAERDGIKPDFADIGNSPDLFTPEIVAGKRVAYSTTNGTQAISMAKNAKKLVIGSFLNIDILTRWLTIENAPVLIFCSGWKNRFNLEDSVFAGALASSLLESGIHQTQCDATLAAIDLWNLCKKDPVAYLEKASHKRRLQNLHMSHLIPYCLSFNLAPVLPILKDNVLVNHSF